MGHLRTTLPLMQAGMTGGDLDGGRDPVRNANVASLKKLFYVESDGATPSASRRAADAALGVLRDIPVARFRMPVLLPHQQTAFNIFQPQLVHLFETLMATEKPWLYLHTHLPGGVDNLGSPRYAFPGMGMGPDEDPDAAGQEAVLHGSIMEVVAAERQADARIVLISQALGRAVVLRGTQALPFSRVDVQLLLDEEYLAAAARAAQRLPQRSDGAQQRRVVLAAAVEEDRCWRAYEFAPVRLDVPGPLSLFASFSPSALDACKSSASGAVSAGVAAVDGDDDFVAECDELRASLAAACEAATQADEGTQAGEGALSEEVALWVELDTLLRTVAAQRSGVVQAPEQLLSLLPPAPRDGWPKDFVLQKLREDLHRPSREGGGELARDFLPCCHQRYPAHRRAQRLSFAVWPLLSRSQPVLQRALEASSTMARLRMATAHMRELREQADTGA